MSSTFSREASPISLASALDSWETWDLSLTARPEIVAQIAGGLTNRSYRLTAPGLDADLLLRINHPTPERLGIQRAAERKIVSRTAAAGVGRPFWHWDPAERFAVFPWLDARTWTDADFACAKQRRRLLEVLEPLKDIDLPYRRRSYLSYAEVYWRHFKEAGLTDPALSKRWQSIQPRLADFDQKDWPARLVHHDLIPSNILETADQLCVIDWEYAAMGHPEIDRWSIEPERVDEPLIPDLMNWINAVWERLAQAPPQ